MSATDAEQVDEVLDAVRREWPLDGADRAADVQAWRHGTSLYEQEDEDGDGDHDEDHDGADDPDALIRAADLMARAVRHHLHGEDVLRGDDLALTVHSLLFAATTPVPGSPEVPQHARRLVRLALAVVRQQGWQPAALGGNGQIASELFEDADIAPVLTDAIGTPDLASFFLPARG